MKVVSCCQDQKQFRGARYGKTHKKMRSKAHVNGLNREKSPSFTSGFLFSLIMVGMDGPYTSASNKPTFNWHVFASATAKLTAYPEKHIDLLALKNIFPTKRGRIQLNGSHGLNICIQYREYCAVSHLILSSQYCNWPSRTSQTNPFFILGREYF